MNKVILSDGTIHNLIDTNILKIEGVGKVNIECASIDLTLGDSFAIPRSMDSIICYYDDLKASAFTVLPKQFILATTKEKITLPANIGGFVTGRSSIGRLGLFAENAGWVDPAFCGEITLELFNGSDNPITIKEGMRIAQIILVQLDRDCNYPYNGKYQNQTGATGSKLYLDKENIKREE